MPGKSMQVALDTQPTTCRAVLRALSTQARVINALLLRECQTSYGQHKLGFVWALIEPVLMVAVFAIVLVFIRSRDLGGMAPLPFMICGILPFMMFRGTMMKMQTGISSNRNLLGFPQLTTFDCIVARGLMEAIVLSIVFVFMLTMSYLLDEPFRVERPLEILSVSMLVIIMGMGGGFLFATLAPIIPSVRQVSAVLFGRPLLLASGVVYTADSVPMPYREWLLYNPVLHAVELIRGALFVQFETVHGSLSYLLHCTLGALALGLVVHQALRRRAIVGL